MGSDISEGEKVLQAGTCLHAPELGILATCGITEVMCYKQPIIGIMSTGNEVCGSKSSREIGIYCIGLQSKITSTTSN